MDNTSICLIIPSLKVGGMERVMSQVANYISDKEIYRVDLILFGISTEVFYPINKNVNIHTFSIPYHRKHRLLFSLKTLYHLRKKVVQLNPKVILSFGEVWNSFVLISLLGTTYPVFISDRCQPDRKFNKLNTFLRKWLYPKADGLIAQTEYAKQFYSLENLNRNIEVIANPITLSDLGPYQRENQIITVGRMIGTKHHDRLITCFAKLNAPNWKLVIVGDDDLKQKNMIKLKELADNLGLKERVVFCGSVRNISQFYLKSKLFVFTSSSEGFPNVIGEALIAGLPVVSYNCVAGPSEMVNEGKNGFLVPVFNDSMLQTRMQSLIDNEQMRNEMSMEAKKSLQLFSIETIGAKILKFITNEDTSDK